jgi:hypothetical protein
MCQYLCEQYCDVKREGFVYRVFPDIRSIALYDECVNISDEFTLDELADILWEAYFILLDKIENESSN